ncbi:peptidoglycan-binding protein [Streptomyces sp. NPDC127098]|uniref:peptidoglycan-binding domain-containing protein n=1 Tax=Streptomyces sp. NPDC127098 TaxID=3347137 RepID=UPI003663ECFE
MRRILSTVVASAALVAGVGLTSVATAGPAAASGWCDGSKGFVLSGRSVRLPYNVASNSTDCTLARGASGSGVTALQNALRYCNEEGDLVVDGDFGPRTETALERAQALRGTTPDGIYGPNTRSVLAWPAYLGGSLVRCVGDPS